MFIKLHVALIAILLCATPAHAQDGFWTASSGGSWSNSDNWDSADGVGGGSDNTAYFGFNRQGSLSPNSTFTFDGPQTIGNLVFSAPGTANWTFNSGPGGSLILDSSQQPPQLTLTSSLLRVTLNVVVAGTAGIEKDGPGQLALAANNTYTGLTQVTAGSLDVTGSIGAGGVNIGHATLSGAGVIEGPVVIGNGGTFAPGNPGTAMVINNSLLLTPGSTTIVGINPLHPAVQGLSNIVYGGTLIITNLPGTISPGQGFPIFGAPPSSGSFSKILPPPGPWLRWRLDPTSGWVTAVSSASQPAFAKVFAVGNGNALQVTGGAPGVAGYLLASDDLTLPKSAWKCIGTNTFDTTGAFICTNYPAAGGSTFLTVLVVPSP